MAPVDGAPAWYACHERRRAMLVPYFHTRIVRCSRASRAVPQRAFSSAPSSRERARAPSRVPGRHPGPGSRPTIRFTAEPETSLYPDSALSRAGGWSVCNGYGAGYKVGPGDQLRFRGYQSTLVGCYGPDSLETRYSRGLAATRRFAIGSDTLVLIAEDGSRLTFVAAPPQEERQRHRADQHGEHARRQRDEEAGGCGAGRAMRAGDPWSIARSCSRPPRSVGRRRPHRANALRERVARRTIGRCFGPVHQEDT